jgi:hypothetical protein
MWADGPIEDGIPEIQSVHLVRATLPANAESFAGAIADAAGWLQVAPRDFVELIRVQWPDWQEPHLPIDLRQLVEAPQLRLL